LQGSTIFKLLSALRPRILSPVLFLEVTSESGKIQNYLNYHLFRLLDDVRLLGILEQAPQLRVRVVFIS